MSGKPPAFMFTDIEGSTQLWEKHPDAMKRALVRHDAILEHHITHCGGRIIKHLGDGIYAVFENGDPIQCALDLQRQFQQEEREILRELRIRIAIHAGHAERRGDDYFGPVINRAARIMSTGWGGQVLLTPDAIEAYALPTGTTLQDLGTHVLKDLSEPQQIYGLLHPDLTLQEFPALRSLSARPHNLPIQSAAFIGREEELAEIADLLDDSGCRLLTLVGPGGTGKTRLALQAAAEKIEAFAQGVYFVPLAALSSKDALAFVVADALKFSFYSREDPEAQLVNYLREKQMLLILDNFEHLLEKAEFLAILLKAAPKVKLLVTSMERLNLQEERVLDIHGLKIPQGVEGIESYSAVQFFVQSAKRVDAGFSLSEEDKPHVVRICQLVEGMPLGIELAAAWVRLLPARDIAREIEQNLDFLATKLRNVQERHRSLRAVFEHSWKGLSEEEREVFQKLSIFRGGFAREAAQHLTGANLPLLSALMDKSLLRRSASGRYLVHELLRQYAEERLKESPQMYEQIHDGHGMYYADFLEQREEALTWARQQEALAEVQEELENVRESWSWAVEHGRQEALEKSLDSLYLFYDRRSRFREGMEALERAIIKLREDRNERQERAREIDLLLMKLLSRQGMFCYRLGLYERAQRLLEESLAASPKGDAPAERALSLNNLGLVAEAFGKYAEARRLYQESFSLRREIGDRWAMALSLNNLGNLAYRLGEYLEAKQLYQESLTMKREVGDRKGTAPSLNNLGNVALALGEYQEAKQLYQESIAIKREIGDQWGTGLSLNNLGQVSEALQEYAEAKQLYQESLSISREIGDRKGIASSLSNLGNETAALGEHAEAKRLYQESLAIRKEIGDRLGMVYCLISLGENAIDLGDEQAAKSCLHEALRAALAIQVIPATLAGLGEVAKLSSHAGKAEQAVEVLALILSHPASPKRAKEKAERLLARLESELPPDVIAGAQARGRERKLEEVAEEVLREP
ncbi:MAG: hypothetical protein A2Z21_04725 [Candidatus Fraserbacteria bacterium RBG_16_55_9]|uniref:Guanylate cyclase domain-containing protein n=1 Tax=Fraserbacteria sp. (strain RBG_16_55_9) TaxID=1817864 RepID=A0A1F5UVC3_FRAXR|nr:MAG: hypothetical protein A2Z21_04725 [Candidatus Fraserbacteria bacterium RBG_16_55_9]